MGLATFKGGVHPYEGKELSESKPIQVLMPKGELVFPLSQHIGAPANPLVKKGDQVLAGQIIAEAGGFISANVVCSVSGTVKAVEPRRVANGAMVNSIVVENDGEYKTVEGVGEDRDYTKLSKEEIRKIVKDAGIVGLGGAGFPTHVKLTPKDDAKIDYVIVNGAECEPYLTSDYRLMMEEPEKVVGGLKVILQLFENAKGVIGVENNKPEAIKKLQELVKDEPKITVCELLTKYPQGGERSLIYAVTGRKVNSSMLPADVGCIVDNVDTVLSIYNAVCKSTPLMRRIVTVTGDAIANPQNFNVKLGTNYEELIEAAGGFTEKLSVAFNDVDLCLKVRETGKLIVYDPYVQLYHAESKTRGAEDSKEKVRRFQEEIEYMRSRWIGILKKGDPYYNKNLSLTKWNYSLRPLPGMMKKG